MKNYLLLPALLILALSQQLNAALQFSLTPTTLNAGFSSFDTEIRVSGGPTDSLQYFAIGASISTLTGGKTINIASLSTLDSLTVRADSDYVLVNQGQATTGAGSAAFVSNRTATSAEFRDGVSVPNIVQGGNPVSSNPVSPNAGKLVAKLRFSLTVGSFAAGDSFQVSLNKILSNANEFSLGGPGSSFSFTGAATGFSGAGTGTDLNNTLVLNSQVFSITAVPEPSSLILIGVACGGLAAKRLRRRKVTN